MRQTTNNTFHSSATKFEMQNDAFKFSSFGRLVNPSNRNLFLRIPIEIKRQSTTYTSARRFFYSHIDFYNFYYSRMTSMADGIGGLNVSVQCTHWVPGLQLLRFSMRNCRLADRQTHLHDTKTCPCAQKVPSTHIHLSIRYQQNIVITSRKWKEALQKAWEHFSVSKCSARQAFAVRPVEIWSFWSEKNAPMPDSIEWQQL